MKKVYKIYKITNLINNKCYIGQTSMDIETRWNIHKCNSSGCLAISGSISKYGCDNFKIEWVASSWDKFLITELENYFMDYYNSMVPNGYNINRANHIGDFSGTTLERMSKSRKELINKMTQEEKDIQNRGIKAYVEAKKRPIIGMNFNYETIEFESTNQAESLHYYPSYSLNDQYTRSKGYVFFYKNEYTIDQMKTIIDHVKVLKNERLELRKINTKESLTKFFENNPDRHITSVNPLTRDIKTYRNMNDAILQGVSTSAIQKSLRGEFSRHKGYHFFYTKDYTIEQMFKKAEETNRLIHEQFLLSRKKATISCKHHIDSLKKKIIGINPKTLEYRIFDSLADSYKEGYSAGGVCPGLRGLPRTSKGLHFQYYTKSIEEHIEIVKSLYSK